MEKEPLPPRPACPCPLHGQGEFTALNQYLLAYRHAGRGPGSWKVKSKCERMEQSQKLWGFKKNDKVHSVSSAGGEHTHTHTVWKLRYPLSGRAGAAVNEIWRTSMG